MFRKYQRAEKVESADREVKDYLSKTGKTTVRDLDKDERKGLRRALKR